jgi:hypothetical protein
MSLDTGGVKYWTGHPGVVAPDDPIATIERVARSYGARWLLVEKKDTVTALAPLLVDQAPQPAWIGRSVWREPAGIPVLASAAAATWSGSEAALFPICLSTSDPRCAR